MSRIKLVPTDIANNKAVNYSIYSKKHYGYVLELGPYDGTDTVYLSRYTKKLVAVEARLENYFITEQWLKSENITNATLILADLEHFNLKSLGTFDCVWASGIIYHMARPFALISQIASITSECFGWTHFSPDAIGKVDGYSGNEWHEDISSPTGLSGLSNVSWWPTAESFVEMWEDLGWTCCYTTPPEAHCDGGLAAQFWARKEL